MKDKEKIAISGLEIEVKGVKHKLTLEQARELKDILDELFKKEFVWVPGVPIVIERPIWIQPYIWPQPVYVQPNLTPFPSWTSWYSGVGSSANATTYGSPLTLQLVG